MELDSLHIILIIFLIFLLIIVILQRIRYSKQYQLFIKINELWVNYLIYARLVCTSYLDNSPRFHVYRDRLIRNQHDLAKLFNEIYELESKQLTDLLSRHVDLMIRFLETFKQQNYMFKQKTIKNFHDNANQIGKKIDGLRKTNGFENFMKRHIDLLIIMVTGYSSRIPHNDLNHFDQYLHEGLEFIGLMNED